jgi:hypothetical protein
MPLLAHILPNSDVPDAAQWTAIVLAAAGGIGILRRRNRILDGISWLGFSIGATAIVVMVTIGLFAPQAPGYALSVAVNPQAASPVPITVCARYPSGTGTKTPDRDHVLTVLVDGVQNGYHATNQFSVGMSTGVHTVRIELLSKDHREFVPVVGATARVDVTRAAQPGSFISCPGT